MNDVLILNLDLQRVCGPGNPSGWHFRNITSLVGTVTRKVFLLKD
jgi:hypothetical protein